MNAGHLLDGPGVPPAVTAWPRDAPTALHAPPDGSAMDTSTGKPIHSPPADPTTEDWLKRLSWPKPLLSTGSWEKQKQPRGQVWPRTAVRWLAAIPGPGACWVSGTDQVTGQKHGCASAGGGVGAADTGRAIPEKQLHFSDPGSQVRLDPLCLVWILPINLLFLLSKSESIFNSFSSVRTF